MGRCRRAGHRLLDKTSLLVGVPSAIVSSFPCFVIFLPDQTWLLLLLPMLSQEPELHERYNVCISRSGITYSAFISLYWKGRKVLPSSPVVLSLWGLHSWKKLSPAPSTSKSNLWPWLSLNPSSHGQGAGDGGTIN